MDLYTDKVKVQRSVNELKVLLQKSLLCFHDKDNLVSQTKEISADNCRGIYCSLVSQGEFKINYTV